MGELAINRQLRFVARNSFLPKMEITLSRPRLSLSSPTLSAPRSASFTQLVSSIVLQTFFLFSLNNVNSGMLGTEHNLHKAEMYLAFNRVNGLTMHTFTRGRANNHNRTIFLCVNRSHRSRITIRVIGNSSRFIRRFDTPDKLCPCARFTTFEYKLPIRHFPHVQPQRGSL